MSMQARCQHTRAHTCRDHSHTLELRWWRVCIRVWRWFALAPQTIHDSSLPNSVFLLDTGNLIWAGTSCQPCNPAFLPVFHRFGEYLCFSWMFTESCAWVKVLKVCECVYAWVYMTAVWPSIKCLFHMHSTSALSMQASGHTDVHVRTDRQTQWMDRRNSSSTHTRTCSAHSHTLEMWLSCGGHMHAHVHVHACMRDYLFPFLSVKTQSNVCLIMCMNVGNHMCMCMCMYICFLFVWFSEYTRQLSA
jgi:hypothetical protein